MRIYLMITVIALTIYAIRLSPFLFIRKPIKNRFIRSFLFYVPYVTLSVMTFPAILTATGNIISGLAALLAGLFVAWIWGDLFAVALSCCGAVFLTEWIMKLL
jgi:branched-subunit amino acid transport protein